jgi:ABC-2 type transport system ATP-binding protein
MLTFDSVSYQYSSAPGCALDTVSFNIPKGAVQGLLGPNGAGKSTLMGLICGHLQPTRGRLIWHRPMRVSLVPQEYAFYPSLTCAENLSCFAGVLGLPRQECQARIAKAAAFCHLDATHLQRRVQACSGGVRRRLNLAIGLLNQPELVLLDEPTVGIDPVSRQAILQQIGVLAAQGVTVVFASHQLEEVSQLCTQVVLLQNGQVLADVAMHTVLHDYASLEDFYIRQTKRYLDSVQAEVVAP